MTNDKKTVCVVKFMMSYLIICYLRYQICIHIYSVYASMFCAMFEKPLYSFAAQNDLQKDQLEEP